jgi:hypothetical protein
LSAFSDYLEDALLDHILRNTAYATPGLQVWVALFDGDPGESGVGATECAMTGYARQQVTAWNAPGGTGATANTNVITFGPCTALGPFAVAGFGIFDANAAGNCLFHGTTTNRTINNGDSYEYAAGDLDVALQ